MRTCIIIKKFPLLYVRQYDKRTYNHGTFFKKIILLLGIKKAYCNEIILNFHISEDGYERLERYKQCTAINFNFKIFWPVNLNLQG